MRKLKGKRLLALLLACVFMLSMTGSAFASIDSFIAKDSEEKLYEYDRTELTEAQEEYTVIGESNLWLNWFEKTAIAVRDTINGIVGLNEIRDKQVESVVSGEDFDADVFAESDGVVKLEVDENAITKVTVDEDGNVVIKPAPVEEKLVVESVSAIDANTISVTFTGEGAPAEAVEITLDTPLVDGQTQVTFTYEEVEYTGTLDEAWVAPVEEGLKVEEVSAINNTGVDVVFKEGPEEDLDDVTIEVLDNKGNVVEVEAVTVAAGETEATFKFVTPFAANYEFKGVWTVGGVKYDFDLKANLAAVFEANNQVELLAALNKLGIENVKEENLPQYWEAVEELETEVDADELTVEMVQKLVNDVNAEAIGAEEEAAIVKAVVDAKKAGNQVALLKALQNDAFVRVNADWIADYDEAIIVKEAEGVTVNVTEDSKIKDIQEIINTVNDGKIAKKVDIEGKVDRSELLKAKALIEAYATPTDKGEQTNDTKKALKAIDIQLAIVDVREASTPTRLKNALIALDELTDVNIMKEEKATDSEEAYKGYIDANARYYLDGYGEGDSKKPGIKDADVKTVANVRQVLSDINSAVETAQEGVNALINNTTVRVTNNQHPKATNGPCYLLGYTVNFNLGDKKFSETKSVVAEFYKGKDLIGTLELKDPVNNTKVKDVSNADGTLDVFGDYDSDSWTGNWIGEVTDIPTKVVVKVEFTKEGLATKELDTKELDTVPFLVEAVNRAETAEEMSRALINLEAQMTDKTDFTNLSKAAKLEVAELTLAARAEEKGIDGIPNTAGKFFKNSKLDADYVFEVVNVKGYKEYIDGVNKVVTEATNEKPATIASMKEALDNKDFLPEFAKLSPADKTLKAEAVLNTLLEMQADKDNPQEFKTIAEIKAAAGL